MDLVNIMANIACDSASGLGKVMGIIGYVIWGIKIVVPIILIIVGMLDMGKAVTLKDEGKIKEAQNALIKKLIAAVIVFLVPTLVGLIMGVIGSGDFRECAPCINAPWNCKIGNDIIGIRGHGKYRFNKILKMTNKDKYIISILKYK